MSKKKHRGSSKIKYEHNMIPGLRELLESIQSWPEIKSIIPGEIKPCSTHGPIKLYVQYPTRTGLKCLAKSGSGVQEVFFVSPEPNKLLERFVSAKVVVR